MKTAIIIILALCLALSIWINREQKDQPLTLSPAPAELEAQPGGTIPPAPGERADGTQGKSPTMDFSGTAFADGAWKLDTAAPTAKTIPGGPTPSGLDDSAFKLELQDNLPRLDAGDPAAPATAPLRSLLTNPEIGTAD